MQLSVSNIIWKKGTANFEDFLKNLVKNNIFAVELSLNSIFEEPLSIRTKELVWLKNILQDYGMSVSALHSLTYTRPDLELFYTKEKREELYQYLLHYIDLARELETKNIVYGSPKSRKGYNFIDQELDVIFLDFLYQIDEASKDIYFNIEPLPKVYCDYLNTFMDGVTLLENTQLKNIFIQLDIRSIIENNENIDTIFTYSQYIKHTHIGEPNLEAPSDLFDSIHKKMSGAVDTRFAAIEVINHKMQEYEYYVKTTIEKTRRYYHDKT